MKHAVVVGSGLSGLVAALKLQRSEYSVTILEKSSRAGGLCGTYTIDGYDFVIACNDFGTGLVRELESLQIALPFHRPQTIFSFPNHTYTMPLTFRRMLPLLPRLSGLLRFAWAAKRGGGYLGPVVRRVVRNADTSDLIYSLCYPLGIHPDNLPLDMLRAQFSRAYRYGYDSPRTPVGGPAALVDALVRQFMNHGGTIAFGQQCRRVTQAGQLRVVDTNDHEYVADVVFSSAGRWSEYPSHCEPSLAMNMLLIALKKDFAYPRNVHTLVHFPPDILSWMTTLEVGQQPERFGFNLFRSDLPEQPDHYTVNAFTLAPRRAGELNVVERRRVESYVLSRLERMLPGFSNAVIYKRFVTATEFQQRTGLSSSLVPRICEAKPDSYEAKSGVYHIGNSVNPPGGHAGAAALSAVMAVNSLNKSPTEEPFRPAFAESQDDVHSGSSAAPESIAP